MLSALVPKIRSCQEDLDYQDIGNALYGLQGMGGTGGTGGAGCEESLPLLLSLLDYLHDHLEKLMKRTNEFKSGDIPELVSLNQHLTLSLPELRDALQGVKGGVR